MIYRSIWCVLLLLLCVQVSLASQWYVGSEGKATNPGTKDAPWDIASALDGSQKVAAGDTIYLLAGTYKRRPNELFGIRLVGSEENPIQIRPLSGERVSPRQQHLGVRIDGGLSVQNPSAYLWVRDLEIFVSEPLPEKPVSPGSSPEDLKRPWGGVHTHGGKDCKYINLIIHNCNQGISCWKDAINAEIYGCIIYNNGWQGTDRGHGHCIYTQNDEGIKVISNCIMSCRFDGTYTVHAYGSEQAFVNNFLVEDNIFYNKGPFLIGGGRPSHNIRVFRNYLYNVEMKIGYDAPYNENCEVRDNIIVNGELNIVKYKQAIQKDNLIIKEGEQRPKGVKAILLPNKFDPKRANLAIINWEKLEKVEVPVKTFLQNGDPFCLVNPEDFFGKPVLQGVCQGDTIEVLMKGEFADFVILKNR